MVMLLDANLKLFQAVLSHFCSIKTSFKCQRKITEHKKHQDYNINDH